jgi:cytoskeletal protein CcmA (bactofilin family)
LRLSRTAALLLAVLAALLGSPTPASARDIGADDEIVITGTVRVPRGVFADRILIADGRVEVDGTVEGVILALDAPVHIGPHAVVDGDVISMSQRVTVDRGATLNQDLIYVGKKPAVARGADVHGDVRELDAGDFSLPFGAFLLHAALWLAFTISSLALGLLLLWLAPGVADVAFTTARERAGPAIAWGLALFVGLPVAALVALLTLVGIPLGLVLLLALFPLYALGYVATSYVLGRAIVPDTRGRIAAFLGGWGILRAIAFIPVLGSVAWLGATVFGLGLLTLAFWQSRGRAAAEPSTP